MESLKQSCNNCRYKRMSSENPPCASCSVVNAGAPISRWMPVTDVPTGYVPRVNEGWVDGPENIKGFHFAANTPAPVAKRDNSKKPPMEKVMLFYPAFEDLSMVMQAGENKYPDVGDMPNWMQGGKPQSEYLGAALRHIGKFLFKREVYDSESGCKHLGHAVWNLLAFLTLNDRDNPPVRPGFDINSIKPV